MAERWVIIGASGGIGSALNSALRARGAEVVSLSRSADGLDVTAEASIRGALDPLPTGAFDGVVVATGALVIDGAGPEKTIKRLEMGPMAAQFALNAAGPALVMKHAMRLLPRDRRAVFAALSARVGSIGDNGLGGWYAYRAAKAALNQLIHTAAIEASRTHPKSICVVLHPGTVETALGPDYRAGHPSVAPAASATNLLAVIDGLTPAETGGFLDWAGKTIPW